MAGPLVPASVSNRPGWDYIHIFVSTYPRPTARAYGAAASLIEGVVLSGVG